MISFRMDDRVDRLLFIPVTPFAGEDNPFLGTNDDATAADSKMVENISELTNENRITSSGLGPHQWRVPPQLSRGTWNLSLWETTSRRRVFHSGGHQRTICRSTGQGGKGSREAA